MKREIKPDHDNPMPPLLLSQISRIYKTIYQECDRLLKEQGFPVEMDQVPVLMLLYYSGGFSQQEICAKLHRDKASINRTVGFLEKNMLVNIIPDEEDRRKTRVRLTSAGRKLAMEVDEIVNGFDASLTAGFTTEEKQQLHDLLARLI